MHTKTGTFIGIAVLAVAGMATAAAPARQKADEPAVKLTLSQVPTAVQETLLKEAQGASIDALTQESEDGQTTYEADVVLGGKTYEIKVAADGTLLAKKLDQGEKEGDKGEEKGEQEGAELKLTLDQVPAAVHSTLLQAAQGAAIDKVDKEGVGAKTVYETDVTIGGKNWEIRVAPDGKLLSKKQD